MALSAQNQNFITDLMSLGQSVLVDRALATALVARWNLNDIFNQLSDGDVAAIFPHLTKSEAGNAVSALQAVLAALGDDVSGQATNLIKLKG